jgi:hypothetical protein
VVKESHQRAPVGSLTLTRLVIGTSVYHNLHALEAGMGNGFMTCKTKRSRISSAGDRTHRMNFVLFQLHTLSLSSLAFHSDRIIDAVYEYPHPKTTVTYSVLTSTLPSNSPWSTVCILRTCSHHRHRLLQHIDSSSFLSQYLLLLASSRRPALCGIRRGFLGACGSGVGGGRSFWELDLGWLCGS